MSSQKKFVFTDPEFCGYHHKWSPSSNVSWVTSLLLYIVTVVWKRSHPSATWWEHSCMNNESGDTLCMAFSVLTDGLSAALDPGIKMGQVPFFHQLMCTQPHDQDAACACKELRWRSESGSRQRWMIWRPPSSGWPPLPPHKDFIICTSQAKTHKHTQNNPNKSSQIHNSTPTLLISCVKWPSTHSPPCCVILNNMNSLFLCCFNWAIVWFWERCLKLHQPLFSLFSHIITPFGGVHVKRVWL